MAFEFFIKNVEKTHYWQIIITVIFLIEHPTYYLSSLFHLLAFIKIHMSFIRLQSI